MKVLVDIDVANFQVRAYYTKNRKVTIPSDEASRIFYFESGMFDCEKHNEQVKTTKNIFPILSKKEQGRLEDFAEPIGTSGLRGTVEVEVDEKKLKKLINDAMD